MRRIIIALASTISGLVLLFSWPTSLNHPVGTTNGTGTTGTATGTGSTAGSAGTATATPSASPQTFTGATASTRYGNVTVRISVSGGALTDATAIEFPSSNRQDQQINNYAIPILSSEAVKAGNAHISMVSGATFTSRGYIQSLQDALDQAGL